MRKIKKIKGIDVKNITHIFCYFDCFEIYCRNTYKRTTIYNNTSSQRKMKYLNKLQEQKRIPEHIEIF